MAELVYIVETSTCDAKMFTTVKGKDVRCVTRMGPYSSIPEAADVLAKLATAQDLHHGRYVIESIWKPEL